MKKVLIVFGTRPEAIKMAPLIAIIRTEKSIAVKICVTAQHRQLLDKVLDTFHIKPDYDLNLMRSGQTLTDINIRVLIGIQDILEQEKPDIVLVHGDTTTTFSAALASFYTQTPVGHVEAGLRSGNIYSPFPEEMNRRLTSNLASLHFAPTKGNRDNLLKSGINKNSIFTTGNTVIDAMHMVVKSDYRFNSLLLNKINYKKRKVILLTVHRRENWGYFMKEIFMAVKHVLNNNLDTELIFPVHLNPVIRNLANNILGSSDRVHLIPPLDYAPFINLMARTYLVLTDSGGIQEEAPALGKPVLVLRNETERPEAVEAGTVKVIGVNRDNIIFHTNLLLDDRQEYNRMAKAVNPYGDGHASERIIEVLGRWFNSIEGGNNYVN